MFLRHPLRVIIIVLALFLITAGVILRFFTPQLTLSHIGPTPAPSPVVFSTQIPFGSKIQASLPAAIPIPTDFGFGYTVTNTTTSHQVLQNLVQKYNLTQDTSRTGAYVDTTNAIDVELVQNSDKVVFQNLTLPPSPEVVSLSEAKSIARTFLTLIGFQPNELSLDESGTTYLTGNPELHPIAPNKSTVITLVYVKNLNGFAVIPGTQQNGNVVITVTKNDVMKAIISPQIFTVGQRFQVPLYSNDEILSNVRNGIFYIADESRPFFLDSQGKVQISSLSFDHVSTEYHLDQNKNVLLPFLHLSGTTLLNGLPYPIDIITPAAKF